MNESTTGRLSENPGCLRCHRLDQFVQVSAVVRDGRSTSVVRGSVTSRYGYDVPVRARVEHTSALARDLAPPVMPRSSTKPVIALGAGVLLALWNLRAAVVAPDRAAAWLGVLFFVAVAVASTAVLRTRLADERVIRPAVEGALRLWWWSWYCRRCAVVSVLTPTGSTTLTGRVLAPALIKLSRHTRWQPRGAGREPVQNTTQ